MSQLSSLVAMAIDQARTVPEEGADQRKSDDFIGVLLDFDVLHMSPILRRGSSALSQLAFAAFTSAISNAIQIDLDGDQ